MKPRKIPEFEEMARHKVGDGAKPNLFFVSINGVILTVTREFEVAYDHWCSLPTDVETCLEDRRTGVICTTTPIEENSTRLVTYDDARWSGLYR
jgi:hypothetical protein